MKTVDRLVRIFKKSRIEFTPSFKENMATIKYRLNDGPEGETVIRTAYGVPCSHEAFDWKVGEVVDLAEYGFVRAYMKKDSVVIERDLSTPPPAEAESFLVNLRGVMIPEYYGTDPERTYASATAYTETISDHYAHSDAKKPRYYLGELVVCGGADFRVGVLREVIMKVGY